MELIKKVRVVDSVVAAMLQAIDTGKFVPGQKIPPERELTKMFGVSRTALREAFQKLEQLGKISIRQGDGTYLNDPEMSQESPPMMDMSNISMDQYIEARELLETMALRLALERCTSEELEELGTIVQEQESCLKDSSKYAELDFKFHQKMIEMTKNRVIIQLWQSFAPTIKNMLIGVAQHSAPMMQKAFKDHKKIYECLVKGELRETQGLIKKHFEKIPGDLYIWK